MRKVSIPDVLAILSISIPVLLFFYRLFFPTLQLIITPDFGQSDAVAGFSSKYFLAQELAAGHIPLWTSKTGGGYPLYAASGMAVWYMPNLLFFSVLPPVIAYLTVLATSLLSLAWGTYYWLRLMSLRRLSSIFGAVTASLSGYVIVQFTHMNIVESISLFPILCALVLLLSQKPSWPRMCLFAVVLSQLMVIGFAQSIFISLLFLTVYAVWLVQRERAGFRPYMLYVTGIILAVSLSAIQLLPSVEYMRQLDKSGTFDSGGATTFSFPWSHLITLFHPFALGNPAVGTYPHFIVFGGSIFWENMNYIGIVPLICIFLFLCMTVLFRKRTRSLSALYSGPLLFFFWIMVGSLFLMTGRNSPLYFIFSLWPFTMFRVPSRFVFIFQFALTVISVISFDALLRQLKNVRLAYLTATLVIVLQVLTVFLIWSPYHNTEPAGEWMKAPSILPYIDRSGYTISIAAERLYNNTYQAHGWVRDNPLDRPSYILRNTFTPDKNLLWDVPHIHDYAGRSLRRSKIFNDLLSQSITSDASHATISAAGSRLLTVLSIKNVVSSLPLTQQGLLITAQLNDPSHQILLYTNPAALPKAYIATDTVRVTTVSDAVRELLSDRFIPGKSVLTESDIPVKNGGSAPSVTIRESNEGRYVFSVAALASDGVFVISETYYPGWRITIDGKKTPVFPVNIRHIGFVIPSGTHTVTAEYRPDSFILGRMISLITGFFIVLSAGLALFLSRVYTGQKVLSPSPGHPRIRSRSSHGRP